MPRIDYAKKAAIKEIDDRLKRYHLKILKCCIETPEDINIHFTKKLDILKGDIIDFYGEDSIYHKAIDKLLENSNTCIKTKSSQKKEEIEQKEQIKETENL